MDTKGVGLNASRFLRWVRVWPATPVGSIHNPRTVEKCLELGYVVEAGPGYVLSDVGNTLVDLLS